GADQALADDRIPIETPLTGQLDERSHRSPGVKVPDGRPLTAERGQGDTPALVDVTDDVLTRYDHIGEEHLVEVGSAVELTDGAHLDARCAHVEHEAGDAP